MSHTAHVLPPLYARWMDELLAAPVPAESNATCGDCAMVLPEAPDGGPFSYRRDTKCCTFLPDLWSFLVGGVLLDDPAPGTPAARGRMTVEARLDARIGVTPLGIGKAPVHALLYDRGGVNVFGKARALRCPHYLEEEGGLCGVWAHRESTCATWFCKHVRGAVGKDFWQHLHQLLNEVEKSLAAWCALELDLDPAALAALYQPYGNRLQPILDGRDVDGLVDPAKARVAWGRWFGREREYYVECARRVQRLDWAGVARVGGAALAVYARLARHAHARLLDEAVPERLVPDLVQISPRGAGRRLVVGYSPLDGFEVPDVVIDLLGHFDGRGTSEVLDEIAHERGVRVDPSLVRKLADFRVLVAAPPVEAPAGALGATPSPAVPSA